MTRKRQAARTETISAADYNRTYAHRKDVTLARNKHHAVQIEEDGYLFDSKVEHRRYRHLKELRAAGLVHDLEVHPAYVLKGRTGLVIGKFTPDFRYRDERGEIHVEDVKGQTTRLEAFRLRCKLLWDQDGIMVMMVTERGANQWARTASFPLPASMRREGRKARNKRAT